MDVRQTRGEWMWFVASAKWNVEVRGVLYSKGKVLVPLLPDEVPFSYSDVGKDVVFLWDPATGVALATERRKAVVVSAPVAPGDSAVALFGEPPKDDGYCYRLVTGEQLDLGEYPTVQALAENGVVNTVGVSYEEKTAGVYHCVRGVSGLNFDQLPRTALVGGSGVMAGYMLLGITAAAYLSVRGVKPIIDGVCVSTAAPVDLAVMPGVDKLCREKRSVRWFAYRWLSPGVVLNMGLVSLEDGETKLPVRLAIDEPSGSSGVVYWNHVRDGALYTRARRGNGATVAVDAPGGLAGIYVYVVTAVPLPDTHSHDVKYTGVLPHGLNIRGSNPKVPLLSDTLGGVHHSAERGVKRRTPSPDLSYLQGCEVRAHVPWDGKLVLFDHKLRLEIQGGGDRGYRYLDSSTRFRSVSRAGSEEVSMEQFKAHADYALEQEGTPAPLTLHVKGQRVVQASVGGWWA